MIVKGRERVGFGFLDLLKSFVQSNEINEAETDREISIIEKAEDGDRIEELIKRMESTTNGKPKKNNAGNSNTRVDKMKKLTIQVPENNKRKFDKKKNQDYDEIDRED